MKVVVVSHMYPSEGVPTKGAFIHRQVRALKEAGANVRVVVPVPWVPPGGRWLSSRWAAYAKERTMPQVYDGVPVARIAYPTLPKPLHQLGAIGLEAALRFAWRDGFASSPRPDLVHAHAITPDGFASCRVRSIADVPVVTTARGSELHEAPYKSRLCRALTRFALRSADSLVVVSGALAGDARRIGGADLRPTVIYNGVGDGYAPSMDRVRLRREMGVEEAEQHVVFVGRCEFDKGVGELLDVFETLSTEMPNLTLRMVGSGGALPALRERVEKAHLSDRVVFVGDVPPDQVVRHLQVGDLFTLPSYGEGMPNALLEAMAVGLPCVATRVGGVPEVLENGITGVLIEPRNVSELRKAIKRSLLDPKCAKLLGESARRLVRARFTWAGNAARHLDIYKETLDVWRKRRQQRS